MNDVGNITVRAGENIGILSPYVLGSMYEWESDEMNGTWAEKAMGRNFETETVNAYASPLYDNFGGSGLDRSRWTPVTYGQPGSWEITDSKLTLRSGTNPYELESRILQDAKWNESYTAAVLVECLGTAALSVRAGDTSVYFGLREGRLAIWTADETLFQSDTSLETLPCELAMTISEDMGGQRSFVFLLNQQEVYSAVFPMGSPLRVALTVGKQTTSIWDCVYISRGTLYDGFHGSESRLMPRSFDNGSGSVSFGDGKLKIISEGPGGFGAESSLIRNSAVDWTDIYIILEQADATSMVTLYGSDNSTFIRFGVQDGAYKVITSSGDGNRDIEKPVSLPAALHIQVQPFYSNGRDFRFYVDGEIVHYIARSKDIPAPDYHLALTTIGTGASTWSELRIQQEHFTDPATPQFEGVGLPVDFAETVIEGAEYGSLNVFGGYLDLYGNSAGSKYGVTLMPFNNSDIKPYKCYAKLTEGNGGFLYVSSGSARGDYSHFVEMGVSRDGRFLIKTDASERDFGPVSTPVAMEMYVGAYNANGRDIAFALNGQPIYNLQNYTGLENTGIRLAVYSDGDVHTQWDYAGGYPLEAWQEDGFDGDVQYSLDDSLAVSGQYSLRMDIQKNTAYKGISQSAISIVAGHAYQYGVWLKKQGNIDSVEVIIGSNSPYGEDYQPYAQSTINSISTDQFTYYSGTLIVSDGDINAKLMLLAKGNGTIWADQVSLMPLDDSEVAAGGFRRDFVEKLRELNPVNLRWPGGIIADWFHFEDGLGYPRDHRPPLYFAQWNASWLNNDVGVDELLRLCEELGIDPTLNINFGTGTPEEAHDFVEYVNGDKNTPMGVIRASAGHPKPYGVKFWEVGNETWASWTPGHTDAIDFATRAQDYITAMREADPTIRIIAEGADGNCYQQGWNIAVAGISGHVLDELSTHYYSPQGLPPGYNDEDVYWASVGAPVSVGERLRLSQNIATVMGRDIKYAITEYNGMYFGSPIRRTRTMESSLQVAGLLHEFLRSPGATGHNNYSCLANFWDGSSMHTGQRGVFVIPSYFVLSLLSNKRGELVVECDTSCDTYNTNGPIGNTPQLTGVPYLDTLCTRSLDGSKLYISIVNRDKDKSYDLRIDIEDANILADSATAYVLTSEDYLDTNTAQAPHNVGVETKVVTVANNAPVYTAPAMSYSVIELDVKGLPSVTMPAIYGSVVDGEGSAIANATVLLDGQEAGVTNAAGHFSIPSVEGEHTLTVQMEGYADYTMDGVYLYGDGVTCQPIRLLQRGVIAENAEVHIVSAISGKALSLLDATEDEGAPVVQKTRTSNPIMIWIAHQLDDGSYYFLNKSSGRALSVHGPGEGYMEGDRIVQAIYTENPEQHWLVEKLEGRYRLMNRKSSLSLDLPSGSSEENLFIQVYYDNGNIAQRWLIG